MQYHFMVLWSIWCQTSNTLRNPSEECRNTFLTNQSKVIRQTTSRTLKVLEKWCGDLSLSYWNQLIADKNNLSFRHKVKAQFSLQTIKETSPQKGKDIDKLATVSVLPPPIPAKFPKKVVEISKFFKKNSDNKGKKSYT